MQTLVIYDIPNDRIRTKVSERCKDAGLERIQYSAFIGDLNHNRREQLLLLLKRTIGSHAGNVRLYPLCDKDLRLMKEVAVVEKENKGKCKKEVAVIVDESKGKRKDEQ